MTNHPRPRLTTRPKSTPHSRFRSGPDRLYQSPHWFACRTRPRAEKKAEQLLGGAGIEAFLPLIYRTRQWADREKLVAFPLFPGYLFAFFDLTQLSEVLQVPLVTTVVKTNGLPSPVRPEEIEAVKTLVERARATGVEPEAVDFLEPGERIVVVDGPFKGLRGELLERRGTTRVAVRLGAIRQAVSVELDRKSLRPLRPGAGH